MKIIAITLIMLIPLLLSAEIIEHWNNTFGTAFNDGARDCLIRDDGSYVMAGFTYGGSNGGQDVLLTAVEADGNELWSEIHGTAGNDVAHAICPAVEGDGVMIAGFTSDPALDRQILLMRLDAQGQHMWTTTWGDAGIDVANDIIATANGDYIVCGYTTSTSAGEDDICVLRVNAGGTVQDVYTIGSSHYEMGNAIRALDAGGYVIAAHTGMYDSTQNSQLYIVRIDESGNVQDEATFGTEGPVNYDYARDVLPMEDGGFLLMGGSAIEGSEVLDMTLVRTDAELNALWTYRYEIAGFYDFGHAMCETGYDQTVLVAGSYRDQINRHTQAFLLKIGPEGDVIDEKVWYADHSTSIFSVGMTADQKIILAGHTEQENSRDQWLVQLEERFLIPEFEALPSSGHAPLEVEFVDHTLANPVVGSFRWDFDGDGVWDSEEIDPSWVYDIPGQYTVQLEVTNADSTVTIAKTDYVRVFNGNSGLEFDGDGAVVTCPPETGGGIDYELTLEAWVYARSFGENQTWGGRIIDKGTFGLFLCASHNAINDNSLALRLDTDNGAYGFSCTPEYSFFSLGWHHVAATYDGYSGEVRLYIDGVPRETTILNEPGGAIQDHSETQLRIGNSGYGSHTFDGMIDEVRLWNVVRTPDEIQNWYQQSLTGTEAGLAASWNMNEGNGGLIGNLTGLPGEGMLQDVLWCQGTPFQTPVDDPGVVPQLTRLEATCYPNPFNPETTIRFVLPDAGPVRLTVYNIRGQQVRSLLNQTMTVGEHAVVWNGCDDSGSAMSSGVYLFHLHHGTKMVSGRMLMMK